MRRAGRRQVGRHALAGGRFPRTPQTPRHGGRPEVHRTAGSAARPRSSLRDRRSRRRSWSGCNNSSSSRKTSSRRWKRKAWNSSIACGPTRTIAPAGAWRSCPCPSSADKQWISLDSLLRMKMDDETDPSGSRAGIARHVLQAAGGLPGPFARRVQRGLAQVPGTGPRNGTAARGLSLPPPDRSGSGLQPLGPLPFCLGVDVGRLPLRAVADGFRLEGPLPAWAGVLCGRHGGDAHRLLHAGDDFRPRAGDQHVRIGGLRRPGRGRDRPDPGVDLSQAFHCRRRRRGFDGGLGPGRQLPQRARFQPATAAARAPQQLLAGDPRDDDHAQLRGLCPGDGHCQHHAGLLPRAERESARRSRP